MILFNGAGACDTKRLPALLFPIGFPDAILPLLIRSLATLGRFLPFISTTNLQLTRTLSKSTN